MNQNLQDKLGTKNGSFTQLKERENTVEDIVNLRLKSEQLRNIYLRIYCTQEFFQVAICMVVSGSWGRLMVAEFEPEV